MRFVCILYVFAVAGVTIICMRAANYFIEIVERHGGIWSMNYEGRQLVRPDYAL